MLRREGVLDPAAAIEALALSPDRVRHYVEFHIEQGPVLQAQGVPLGVVSGIAGQTWLNVHIVGEQGHAGTVPMHMRADPLAAAAEAVLMIETLCKGLPWVAPGGGDDQEPSVEPVTGEALVCTVGRLVAQPGQVRWGTSGALWCQGCAACTGLCCPRPTAVHAIPWRYICRGNALKGACTCRA